jgi:hypothetical protein
MGVWYFDDYESMRVFDNDWEDIYWLDESPLPVQQQPTPKQEVQDELKNDWHPLSKLSNQPVQPIVGYTREQVEKAMHDTWNQVYYSMTHPDVTEPKEEFSFVADYLSTLPTPSNVSPVSSSDGWVDVKEKPTVYSDILVCLEDNTVLMGRYEKGIVGEWLIYWANEGLSPIEGSNRKVIKWRYLPSTQNSK